MPRRGRAAAGLCGSEPQGPASGPRSRAGRRLRRRGESTPVAPRRTGPSPAVARLAERARAARVLGALVPSRTSAIVALLLLVAAAGAYVAARETPLFAVQAVDVRGASPDTARAVREVLAPVEGRNLLALDAGSLAARVARVPTVAHAELDRAFPHTLVVYVREERPAAVVRRGAEAWLVASTGRVLDRATRGVQPRLARIWVPKRTALALGERVADPGAAAA